MKKVITVLMALCLLCSAAALAETPTFESMPGMVIFDSFFEGSWEAGPAFANEIYVDLGDLAREYSLSIPMVTINADEKLVIFEGQSDNGEFVREEYPYTLDNSQLECQDDEGRIYVFELLKDGSICMETFVEGVNEPGTIAITVFMVRANVEK